MKRFGGNLVLYFSQIEMVSKPYTVKHLWLHLAKAIEKWHWDKFIFTADDVEWNGYHWMYYWLETDAEQIENLDDNGCISWEWFDYKDVVILW